MKLTIVQRRSHCLLPCISDDQMGYWVPNCSNEKTSMNQDLYLELSSASTFQCIFTAPRRGHLKILWCDEVVSATGVSVPHPRVWYPKQKSWLFVLRQCFRFQVPGESPEVSFEAWISLIEPGWLSNYFLCARIFGSVTFMDGVTSNVWIIYDLHHIG